MSTRMRVRVSASGPSGYELMALLLEALSDSLYHSSTTPLSQRQPLPRLYHSSQRVPILPVSRSNECEREVRLAIGSIREAASGRHRRASHLQLPVSPSVGSSAMSAALKHASAPCCMRVTRCTRDASRSNPTRIHRLLHLLQLLAL